MDQLMDILSEYNSEIDFETYEALVDDEILLNDDLESLAQELNDAYDINITANDIVPENFNSAELIWELIQRLSE
ncbi:MULTISPECIES: hypothetical protein [Lachnospira]|uniref:Phosphopantetheine attachment site n=2 Tax=Lachnospira TaxID=28050 RepID=A0A1H5W9A6_9FIRM|nr:MULTISPECIES: hypothetical protein [Lachnospira]MCR5515881.1 acyl carrier protein [Lachnospira sp.]SDN21713.1 hypothetical protein SAMN05216544_2182 [Lachnospira pectinoschiza]SEF96054.1 hypothetical protein SAMN05216537_11461 [Lachnospira multipara]